MFDVDVLCRQGSHPHVDGAMLARETRGGTEKGLVRSEQGSLRCVDQGSNAGTIPSHPIHGPNWPGTHGRSLFGCWLLSLHIQGTGYRAASFTHLLQTHAESVLTPQSRGGAHSGLGVPLMAALYVTPLQFPGSVSYRFPLTADEALARSCG